MTSPSSIGTTMRARTSMLGLRDDRLLVLSASELTEIAAFGADQPTQVGGEDEHVN